MDRPRRTTFIEACRSLNILEETDNAVDGASITFEEDIEDDTNLSNSAYADSSEVDEIHDDVIDDEGDIDVFSQDGDEADSADEFENSLDDENNDLQNSKNIVYSKDPYAGHLLRRNIMRETPRCIVNPKTFVESFLLFFTEEMFYHILRCTNIKVKSIHKQRLYPRNQGLFSIDELKACIALLLRAGVDRDNFSALEDLWDVRDSKPFYRAVMSYHRFKFFLSVIRFDDIRTREQRKENNVLAAFSEMWDLANAQFLKFYIPQEDLTVDEQLVGYRGCSPGRTYMPSKPRKYGVKIFWICEAETGFALQGLIYTGKRDGEGVHYNLAYDIVKQLTVKFYGSGRNIVCDNYFTSHALAVFLLSKNLTLLGTVRSHRKEIPNYIKTVKGRQALDTRAVYDHEQKIMLLSYCPKKNKNVILLTSGNHTSEVDDSEKRLPIMIKEFYNKTKGGVDLLDASVETYTVRRKTVRWPLVLFFNCLDVMTYNSYIMMKRSCSRKQFLKDLTFELARPYAEKRLRCKYLHKHITQAATLVGYMTPISQMVQQPTLQSSSGRCLCKRKTRSFCDVCREPVCPEHRILTKTTLCRACVESR